MRQVSSETVEWFGKACRGGVLTRTALARGLCERENWYGKVVCNNRFVLLSGVRVKGLASRALLAQTFTGPGMSGLSYRAAGWRCCPELSSGRRSGSVRFRRAGARPC